MTKRINLNIFFVGLISVLITAILTMGVYYSFFETQVKKDLQSHVETVAKSLNIIGDHNKIDTFADENMRLTLINKAGTVLYDSSADVADMDNHLNREEVKSAIETGKGQSSRRSGTMDKNTFYYAIRLDNGDILRASVQGTSMAGMFFGSFYYMGAIILIILLISFVISRQLTKNIVKPIEKMANTLDTIDEKQIPYEELNPFAKKIKEQKKKQKQVDKIKRQFTANVSHELKTPLTSIMGYAELIEKDIAKGDDVKKFATTIHNETRRLINLTGDIIQLSQLDEWEEGEKAIEKVDLYQCAENCLNALTLKASKRSVQLNLEGESATIQGNPGLIEDLIYNLTENAIRYNKENGSVTVTISKDANQTILTVADTGIGIPKKYQNRVFERFYRVDKSRSKQTGGTGLGLAIVKHIVEYHNGTINLESTENVGTIITIVF